MITSPTDLHSAAKEKTAIFIEQAQLKERIYDGIDTFASIVVQRSVSIIDDKDFSQYFEGELTKLLRQNLKWQEIEHDITLIISQIYSENELDSYINFSYSDSGRAFLSKGSQLDEALSKFLEDKTKGLSSEILELSKSIAEKYKKHLALKQPSNVEDIKRDGFYYTYTRHCQWPIPSDLQLKTYDHSQHEFFDPNFSLFEKHRSIIFKSFSESIEDLSNDEGFTVSILREFGSLKLYKVIANLGRSEIESYVVEINNTRITMYGLPKAEIDYMFNYCVETSRNR